MFKNDRPEGVRRFKFFQLLMQLVLMLCQQAEFQIDLFDVLLEILLHNFQLKLKIVQLNFEKKHYYYYY